MAYDAPQDNPFGVNYFFQPSHQTLSQFFASRGRESRRICNHWLLLITRVNFILTLFEHILSCKHTHGFRRAVTSATCPRSAAARYANPPLLATLPLASVLTFSGLARQAGDPNMGKDPTLDAIMDGIDDNDEVSIRERATPCSLTDHQCVFYLFYL